MKVCIVVKSKCIRNIFEGSLQDGFITCEYDESLLGEIFEVSVHLLRYFCLYLLVNKVAACY